MKRSFLLILLLSAFPLLASERVIVEFREAPLAVRRGVTAKSYDDTRARFRRDVANLAHGKSAGEIAITDEYYRAFHGAAVTLPAASIDALRALPYVAAIHYDTEVQAYAVEDSVAQVGAKQIWSTHGSRGQGMVIAVLDTGIDYNHPAFGGGFGPGRKVIGGWDFVNKDADPMDDQFHGTHVAGIIAAKSNSFTGVAPEASLIAFKVLNSNGRGLNSQIIAAIERTLDPNDDGNLDDAVDVANLSLGGPGGPNDATSRAVDNATVAGVVFCIAAGNDGDYLRIGSPGNAESAITVGASTGTKEVAIFSSRGPNTFDSAVKPEVVAPGDNINSTLPGGAFGTISGTSMATPHVAGLAALLRQLHPEWTPAQVKSALITTAKTLNDEVMAQGAGLVDGMRAATASLLVSPAHVSFGLANIANATWTSQQKVRLTNHSMEKRQYTLSAAEVAGAVLTFAPGEFELNPGSSRDVTITLKLTVADAVVGRSFGVGGLVRIDGGPQPLHLPWGTVKAARALVNSQIQGANSVWFSDTAYAGLFAQIDPHVREWLLPAGTYDLVVSSKENGTRLRLHFREHEVLTGSHVFNISPDEPMAALTFSATDHRGERLFTRAERLGTKAGYSAQLRVVRHPDSFLPLPLSGRISEVLVSPVSDKWEIHPFEVLADLGANEFYVVEHDTVHGMTAQPRTLTRTPGDLMSAVVQLNPLPNDPLEEIYYIPYIVAYAPGSYVTPDNYTDLPDAGGAWRGQVWVTERQGTYVAAAMLDARSERGQLLVPALQGRGGRVVSSSAQDPTPSAYWAEPGETLTFGNGPFFSRMSMFRSSSGQVFMTGNFMGQLNDWRNRDSRHTTAVFRGDGRVLKSGAIGEVLMSLDTKTPMAYELEMTNRAYFIAGREAAGTSLMRFDTRRNDVLAPTITSFRVLDGNARATQSVPMNGNAMLAFSAADYHLKENLESTYQRIAPEATKVWWRRDGGAWHELTATSTGEYPDGIFYRVNLAPAARSGPGAIDVRVEVADDAGNSTVWTLSPAFAVEAGGRRRSALK
ncbi:MAG TPA: S8 family serine peptidase [Thermoanaerobaculia bacterium]